jgi:predicted MPP superfamily phosphohydrolase
MEPLRIAFVSDLHLGALAGRDRLEKIVSMINGEIPDLVLLGGDYTYRAPLASLNELFQPLRQLRARLGVFSVFGNHDQARHDERRSEALSRLFASYGIRVLRNEWVRLEEQLHLVGIDDVGTRKADLVRAVRGLPAHQLTVFLAHNADFLLDVHPSQVFPESGERGFLWLFGHTHGGQVRLPWIGPLYRSGKAPWVLGRYQTEWGTMVVTAGVGEIYLPIRIGCPPEIVVIDCR